MTYGDNDNDHSCTDDDDDGDDAATRLCDIFL